jgi:hypothetical protein
MKKRQIFQIVKATKIQDVFIPVSETDHHQVLLE